MENDDKGVIWNPTPVIHFPLNQAYDLQNMFLYY